MGLFDFIGDVWDELSGNADRRREAHRERDREAEERNRENKKRYDEGYSLLCRTYERGGSERKHYEKLAQAEEFCNQPESKEEKPEWWINPGEVNSRFNVVKDKMDTIKIIKF